MRKIWDIPGGVHPPENKHRSLTDGIGAMPLPERLILPLDQHIGAPAKPVVAIGDRVLKGQLIAAAEGFISASVHAPTSGTIEAIADHPVPHPSGMTSTCIFIAPDGEERWCELRAIADHLEASNETLLDAVKAAGITGMGGAGFPTAVKLHPHHKIDTLIINGTECEPYITADDILMQERAADIVEGIKIIARLLGNPPTVLIGVEDNKPRAYEAIEAVLGDTGYEVVEFPTKYPSGGEKQLIQILTGKEVPSGKLPADLGVVCQNVGTAYAIFRAVMKGEPLISRITTVTGKACATTRNYEVLLGTPVDHLLKYNGFDQDKCTRLVMGGPMMGFSLPNTSVPVIKTTNCILACDAGESPPVSIPQQPCIRCGLCAEACPASLLPQQLFWYSQSQNYERAREYNLFDCIECGACAYVCPSTIPLVQYYRAAKGEIRALDAEKRKSDHARQRFEFHKARLEQEEAEKIARREARRRAAEEAKQKAEQQPSAAPPPAAGGADDLIKAAMARAAERQASPEQQKAKLERGLESAKNRVDFAREKLADAGADGACDDHLEQLRVKVKEAERKLAEAQAKLDNFAGGGKAAVDFPAPASTDTGRRVMEKLETPAREQLEQKIAGLRQRIATAEEKMAAESDETLRAALAKGLEKQRAKLAEAQQQLEETGAAGAQPAADPATTDAAAAAIARAREKADALAKMSPLEKLDANIEALEKRLEKTRQKLDKAVAEGADQVEILRDAAAKLEEKLQNATEERSQLSAGEGEKSQ